MLEEILPRAVKRESELYESFLQFSHTWSVSSKSEAQINRRLLLEVTSRYFLDIETKKAEHAIEWVDAHKRAAFTVKWLLNFKPIQYYSPHTAREHTRANEEFALFIACAYLHVELKELPESLVQHILNHFRHEFYHPEPWACTFFMIEKCSKAQLLPALNEYLIAERQ